MPVDTKIPSGMFFNGWFYAIYSLPCAPSPDTLAVVLLFSTFCLFDNKFRIIYLPRKCISMLAL
jgi:hypothetical protein